ncbi:MAG: DUF4112 domain-containing protein [Opitutaceae bacterium]
MAIPIPRSSTPGDSRRRLNRLRKLAWLLDRSIPVGRWRIGIDPILGLLPGAGDWIAAVLSLYIVYESARLGAPAPLLMRMAGNILLEALIGTVPLLGDLFDFAWQANMRNLALIERHYQSGKRVGAPRSLRRIGLIVAAICFVVLAVIAALIFLLAKVLDRIVQ